MRSNRRIRVFTPYPNASLGKNGKPVNFPREAAQRGRFCVCKANRVFTSDRSRPDDAHYCSYTRRIFRVHHVDCNFLQSSKANSVIMSATIRSKAHYCSYTRRIFRVDCNFLQSSKAKGVLLLYRSRPYNAHYCSYIRSMFRVHHLDRNFLQSATGHALSTDPTFVPLSACASARPPEFYLRSERTV